MSDPTTFTLVTKTTTDTGAGDAIHVPAAKGFQVLAVAGTASSSTVLIQGSFDNSVWHTLITISNVGAAPNGSAYRGGAWPYMRANVSVHASGGTITVYGWALDYDPGYWVSCTAPTNTATAVACTSLTDSGLTSGRVTVATTGGLLADQSGLTATAGALTAASVTASDLTSGRITVASTAGLLADQSGLTAAAGVITCANLIDSGLTATRVPFANGSKQLADDSTFTFNATTKALAATTFLGGQQVVTTAKATNGAIASAPGTYLITKGSALGSSTVANPTTTDHDGYIINFISTTAYQHVITFNTGKINGGSNITVTLGGAVGDGFGIIAYQGVWYTFWAVNATVAT